MVFIDPYSDAPPSMEYDVVVEIEPGVWRTLRKTDRVEHLAYDVSNLMVTSPTGTEFSESQTAYSDFSSQAPTAYSESPNTAIYDLLNSDKFNMLELMGHVLNHHNLVSMKEMLTIEKSIANHSRNRYLALWDYCDAGVLANLLVRPPALPVQTKTYPGDKPYEAPKPSGADEMELDPQFLDPAGDDPLPDVAPMEVDDNTPMPKHLPESLCWHILTSVMRALAWLHDGATDIAWGDVSDGPPSTHDWNWHTILHRNITPANIFLMHPKRDETYGTCKLGNYSYLHLASHKPGGHPRERSKALGPPTGAEFIPLDELVRLDNYWGYTYPQQPHQPCTVVTDLRALGETMQAMMLPPVDGDSLGMVRQRTVEDNLSRTGYTNRLKNMILMLMTVNPDEKDENGQYRKRQEDRDFLTTRMCYEVHYGFVSWMASDDPEARYLVLEEEVRADQEAEDMEEMAAEQGAKQTVEDFLNAIQARVELEKKPKDPYTEYPDWPSDDGEVIHIPTPPDPSDDENFRPSDETYVSEPREPGYKYLFDPYDWDDGKWPERGEDDIDLSKHHIGTHDDADYDSSE
ncbi:hypothetical protein F5Y04DRAFT_193967 [Hypomontagnella monticulosa]|nr:hypothetical protein F5Y04DRAFT_193967 [Hypomontagnella monticulosa]